MKLNKEQQEAINYINGPLLVLAGAGSGKTRVIIERIMNLINNHSILPSKILAITFTNKAAKEMKARLNQYIDASRMDVSTFHKFGLKVIRTHYELLNLNKNFSIIDGDDVLSIIKKILKEFSLKPAEYSPYYIKEQISMAKNRLVGVQEYKNLARTEIDKIVAEIYIEYQKILKKNHAVDFDDLLIMPYKLLKSNSDILTYYQDHYNYILVDEYQDTNEVQYQLIKLLAARDRNLCVVGDIDQSIYSWRGANYRNILNFEQDFNDAKIILLEQNYRSTNNILKVANSIIENNTERKDKKLFSDNNEGNLVQHIICDNEIEEAKQVIKIIESLGHENLNDVCILYRTNAQSRNIEEELLKNNIPYRLVGGFGFYNRKEIKDLLAYLKLINNPNDDINLTRIINEPKRKIGTTTIDKLSNKAKQTNSSIYSVIETGNELKFKQMIIDLIDKSNTLELTELVEEVLSKTGLKAQYNPNVLEDEIRLENLNEFKSITKSYEDKNELISLNDFLSDISLLTDVKYDDNDNAVTLMTMHSVKGLEYKSVIIVGMEESILPHFKSIDDAESIEEERRLCYVAITRAMENCYLLSTKKRMLFGQLKYNKTSRFIEEIDKNYLDIKAINKLAWCKPKHQYDNNNDFKTGDKVLHKIYGPGVIIDIKDNIGTVVFNNEIKKILIGHSYLTKE